MGNGRGTITRGRDHTSLVCLQSKAILLVDGRRCDGQILAWCRERWISSPRPANRPLLASIPSLSRKPGFPAQSQRSAARPTQTPEPCSMFSRPLSGTQVLCQQPQQNHHQHKHQHPGSASASRAEGTRSPAPVTRLNSGTSGCLALSLPCCRHAHQANQLIDPSHNPSIRPSANPSITQLQSLGRFSHPRQTQTIRSSDALLSPYRLCC